MQNMLKWLGNWYLSHCDGEWEHGYGVKIDIIDNPGWRIDIDLKDTELEDIPMEKFEIDNGDSDWIVCWLEKKGHRKVFNGCGDPHKLEDILLVFKEWVESNSPKMSE